MSQLVVRVSKRNVRVVLAVGILAGVGVAAGGPRPTGSTAVDSVLIVVAVTGAVWGGATAPWWALIAASGLAAATSPSGWIMVAGAVAFVASAHVGMLRRSQVVERAAIAGIVIVLLARLGTSQFFGFTSIIGVGGAVVLAGMGLWRRPSVDRKIAAWAVAVAFTYCLVAVVAFGLTGLATRSDLSEGNSAAQAGLSLLKQGDFSEAQASFAESARRFESAHSLLDRPWVQLARLVPIAGQHRTAADELAGGAAAATRAIDIELRRIDFNTLTVRDGRIDIDAVRALQQPMQNLQSALERLDTAVELARSPWLVDALQVRIDDLSDEIAQQRVLGAKAIEALKLAPAMLGADGERVYFVMFTTEAEARGQGGFMGNYAELSIDDGRIEMTAFGRKDDLVDAANDDIVISGPEDWLTSYGVFGFQSGPGKVFDPRAWANITMSPNFPSTAQVVAELYPRSGGREIDGVINLDVFAVQKLVGFVGPIELKGVSEPLTGENTAEFLFVDQYSILDRAARTDMLQRVAEATVNLLLQGSPPDPIELGQGFAPLVRKRNVMMWAREPAEQALLAEAHVDGALLPDLNGAHGLAVTVNNAGGNKIDSFLKRDYSYQETTDESGDVVGELTINLRNSAPSDGLPAYIIDNLIGQPSGSNRLLLTVFSTYPVVTALVDGKTRTMFNGSERGLRSYSTYVDIPSNDESTLHLTFARPNTTYPKELVIQSQPGVAEEQWRVKSAVPAVAASR